MKKTEIKSSVRVTIPNLRSAVMLALSASDLEIREAIEAGARRALKDFDLEKMIYREARDVIQDLFTEITREEIRAASEDVARTKLRREIAPVIEKLFREWLSFSGANDDLQPGILADSPLATAAPSSNSSAASSREAPTPADK